MELLTVAKNGFLHYSWMEQNRSNAILQSCNIFNLTQHLKNTTFKTGDLKKCPKVSVAAVFYRGI